MAPQTATSSISMALAGKTASVDIPKPRDAGNGSRASRSGQQHGQPAMLPTPPNSISPTLPPHAFKHKHAANLPNSPPAAPVHVDSDLDLQDAVEHAKSQDQPPHGPATNSLESAGAITPALLAKYHLPEILLTHGPLAIRHIMGYLTTSVPGFAGIPPAKARRLVVGALEGRGNGGEGGGVNGDVIFEKVGWGRWDARRRGQPARDRHAFNSSPPSSVPSSYQQGVQIPQNSQWRNRDSRPAYGTSMAGDSAVFSHSEDLDYGDHEDVSMLEHEADKMSLDGDSREYCSSEAPDDAAVPDDEWDDDDVTDEEDWANIGADALRARSLNGGGILHTNHLTVHSKQQQQHPQRSGGGPASFAFAKSVPGGIPCDLEERAAVEALLKLGSM
ncbi:hypothetical protein VTN77DRAFT_43 [Rasamsonia byssochlamydoides]|uniref:uncharacterized protein n=1 Tax=Rasamsonia byssochlamydoides TaxID=89139 RepID=UPI003743FD60